MLITFNTVEEFIEALGLPPRQHDQHVKAWEWEQRLARSADGAEAVRIEAERILRELRASRAAMSAACAEVDAYMAKRRHLRSVA